MAGAVVQLLAIGPGGGDQNRECSATGFLVNEDGYILTSAHVVHDARRCLAGSSKAKILAKLAQPTARTATAVSCDLLALDDAHDLAVLKVERPLRREEGPGFATLALTKLTPGTIILATSHPGSGWSAVTQAGSVIRHATLRLFDEDENTATSANSEKCEILVLDMPLRIGSSGSPVYLQSGEVVGVVSRRDRLRPPHTIAVPIRYAIALLDRHRVRWHASPQQ